MGKEKKRRKRLIALPSSLPLKVHASAHAQRSSQCRQHRHDDLNHRLPKFLVLHTLLLLCKQQLFLTNHEGRRARERQRERSGNFTNSTNFLLRPTCFFQTEIIKNYSEINSFNSFNSWSF